MKLSENDQKQIDRLYALMEREESDPDTAAALRWAIFQLEQQGREKQTGDLVSRLASMPEPEINSIMDTGVFNDIVKGYLVTAMQAAGKDHSSIQMATMALDLTFNVTDAAAARKAYQEIKEPMERTREIAKHNTKVYLHSEEASDAALLYMMQNMNQGDKESLSDPMTCMAISRLFHNSPEEDWEKYGSMTPEELVTLEKEKWGNPEQRKD